jgi:menaquinone-dependent protoporphyrinogen IX oxidase
MNFYDGAITEFSMEKAEELLSRDPVLFAEYMKLNRRNRKEQVNRYIRRFNEAHPVYFLKY